MKRCGGFISFKFIDDGVERSLGPECSLDVLNDTENVFWGLRLTAVFFSLCVCSVSAAETVMDTRVATAELGWTAYPNSGVSGSLAMHAHAKRNRLKSKVLVFKLPGRK